MTIQVLLVLLLSVFYHVSATKPKILSLGGNGMIGSETLQALIPNYDITLVSRGSWPFDAQERIAPHVHYIHCDRELDLGSCDDLQKAVKETESYYAVLDFSGYYHEWVVEALEVLQGKARVYMYLSTDSIYEVTTVGTYAETGRKLKETDDVRPESVHERAWLEQVDDYGHEKLLAEEVLQRQEETPFVTLRLADVLGPRDGTDRFVIYYTWIKFLHTLPPLLIHEDVLETTSVTYVKDAAQTIQTVLHDETTWNQTYNIACEEIFNVTAVITKLAEIMGKGSLTPIRQGLIDVDVYPSVTKGPVDISKAKETLNFRPTSIQTVLEETVAFYDQWYETSMEFREEIIDIFEEYLKDFSDDEHKREAILEGLEHSMISDRDEL